SGRVFVDIMKRLSGNFFPIGTNEPYQTNISALKSEFKLIGYDPAQYALLTSENDAESIVLKSSVLITFITQINSAFSISDTRPVLTGVNWQFNEEGIKFIASDSHRLALRILNG